ncbi:uncharacterized protein F5Z01DRAFT_390644 [Emericellopsis atlantica]|uniref:Uncharacterized protein n=1 Tax=Emericellopsis atlantica TaxID=2614577 RepID=A0A9P7ZTM7_9HYPO|nr:uncharacterized protein F5Z01DRAFT_390644 [Emericellopsis atlantica]KAG9257465.1 hypothetical protein F5Z01DRAFT_390644 [Emericellopsis atlantica]
MRLRVRRGMSRSSQPLCQQLVAWLLMVVRGLVSNGLPRGQLAKRAPAGSATKLNVKQHLNRPGTALQLWPYEQQLQVQLFNDFKAGMAAPVRKSITTCPRSEAPTLPTWIQSELSKAPTVFGIFCHNRL